MAALSVIVVTYNSEADIRPCLESLLAEVAGIATEVFVVDNASKDATVSIVRSDFPSVRLIANQHNAGFPGANNQAIHESTGEYVLLLNPDTIVPPGAIRALLSAMERHPDVGLCGPRLVDGQGLVAPDIRFPSLSKNLLRLFVGDRFETPHLPADRIEVLSGAALLARRAVYDRIGLLDERMFWREDADFCYRAAKAGYAIRVVEDARITHLVGRSAVSNLEVALEKPISSEIAFFMKHHGRSAAAVETVLLACLTLLRLVKWEGLRRLKPSSVAETRANAFRRILRRLPTFYRSALDQHRAR